MWHLELAVLDPDLCPSQPCIKKTSQAVEPSCLKLNMMVQVHQEGVANVVQPTPGRAFSGPWVLFLVAVIVLIPTVVELKMETLGNAAICLLPSLLALLGQAGLVSPILAKVLAITHLSRRTVLHATVGKVVRSSLQELILEFPSALT